MITNFNRTWLFAHLRRFRGRLIIGCVLIAVADLAAITDPQLMRLLLDRALPSRDTYFSLIVVLGIAFCYLVRAGCYSLASLATFSLSQAIVSSLRSDLFTRLLALPLHFHESTHAGERFTVVNHDVDQIAAYGADSATQGLRAVVFFLVNLAMMAALNLSMTIVLLPIVPVFILVQRYFNARGKAAADSVRLAVGHTNNLLTEELASIPQHQSLGTEQLSFRRLLSGWDLLVREQLGQRTTQVRYSLCNNTLLVLSIASTLSVGSIAVSRGSLSIGGLVAFYTYLTRLFDPLQSAMDLYARTQSITPSVTRVADLLVSPRPTADSRAEATELLTSSYALALDSVGFSYGPGLYSCAFTLSIPAGQHTAIVGASGAGKSTLAKLLSRAVEPTSGTICLGAVPLSEYSPEDLRKYLCYVPQQAHFIDGTIKDNITLGQEDVADPLLAQILRLAMLEEVVARMPLGLETQLGPGAYKLSGGERQRVALARAFLRRPSLLILDEAMSALDPATEQAVLTRLLSSGLLKTVILISHRIRWIPNSMHIIVLDKGLVVASGRHTELAAASSLYSTLYFSSEDPLT